MVASHRSRALVRAPRSLRRLRTVLVLGILSLALLIIELVTGCDTTEEQEPSVYYGPPTVDVVDDATVADTVSGVDAVTDVPSTTDLGPVVYYGPQPVDALDDVPSTTDLGPVVYYGPQPVDALDDVPSTTDLGPVVYYGPQPVDALDDVPSTTDLGPVVYYGPQPVDVVAPADLQDKDCPPIAFYGPQPCMSDDDCVEWYGAGWYCDLENEVSDGCGGTFNYPMCEPPP